MKKTIRLTEGDLRRLVEGALNELDWKTYANAAKGREKQATYGITKNIRDKADKSVDDLSSAAKQNFFRKHKNANKELWYDYSELHPNPYRPVDDFREEMTYPYNFKNLGNNKYTYNKNNMDRRGIKKADVDAYADYCTWDNNRSKYVPNQGWNEPEVTKMESLIRGITESIIRKLKR